MDLGVPFYPGDINESPSVADLSALFSYIDSSWQVSNVNTKVFTNGLTNKLIGCFHNGSSIEGNGSKKPAAVVVRIFGRCTEKFLDRERELAVQFILSKAGFAPPVFVKFANGVCYGFVSGQTVTVTSVREPHISSLIAEKIATFHCLSLEQYMPKQSNSMDSILQLSKNQPCIWSKIDVFMNIVKNECLTKLNADDRFLKLFGSFEKLQEEIRCLKLNVEDFCAVAQVPPVVSFCHNDLLLNNVLFDASQDQVHFIDFEYADYNYAAFDIANHFVEYCGVDDVDFDRFPSAEYQFAWIKTYLSKRKKLLSEGAVTDVEVRLWFVFVQKMALASYLLWSVWALVQNQFSTLDFDYIEFADQRYSQYLKHKSEFINLSLDKP